MNDLIPAPYREPKLPPPDFIPSDTGVGVALPPENEPAPEQPAALTTEKLAKKKPDPFKSFLFDEEKFISQMENFHSKRRDELINSIEVPRLQINLVDSPPPHTTPRFTPTTPTPSIIRSTSTTTALPSTTSSQSGFFLSTSTPSSYSYAYQHEAQPVSYN